MADKSITFQTRYTITDSQLEVVAKWLSCNGEVWGVGPTALFASAAALFLYHELEAAVFIVGDHATVSLLEKTLVSSMVIGMLSLMVHIWVCSMRFFQYYLDTLIKDSPNVLLEMTTAGLLGSSSSNMAALGPLTRFLRQQQPQIHITVCWFLSLCYADYVRKNYCHRFNMPFMEQWQAELHERAARGMRRVVGQVNSFVGSMQRRLRGFTQERSAEQHTRAMMSDIDNSDQTPIRNTGDAVTPKLSTVESLTEFSGMCPESEGRASAPDEYDFKKELPVRLLGQSSETSVEAFEKLRQFIQLVEKAKCGDGLLSIVPTAIWAVGAAALGQRVLTALFRRFVFRRVPLWELILQNLLFIWMVIYSLHFWRLLVQIVKIIIEYCYQDTLPGFPTHNLTLSPEDLESQKLMQQWLIWMCAMAPIAVFIHTRPRPESPPLMIWITTSPWQRREMGPYGYYLNRPLSSLQSHVAMPAIQQAKILRKAFSDSNILIKEPPKRKRHSKSV